MARQFLTGLNLNKNELLNARIQNLANDPSSPVLGQIYFNTSANELRVYNGSEFEAVGINGVTASAAELNILDGATITTTELNYLDGVSANVQTQLSELAPKASPVFTGDVSVASNIVFEGATANSYETTLTATDPTADRAITLPNASGEVILDSNTVNDLTLPSGNFSMNDHRIVAVAAPVDGTDAANKTYVDNAVAGLTWKQSVNLLASTNVALTGDTETLVIDSHAALDSTDVGYRILLINQSTDSQNGLYVYGDTGTTYTLTRATDADVFSELVNATVFVSEGTVYGQSAWTQANHYLTDFTGQDWVQFSGAAQITAGNGLTKTGNTIDAVGTSDRITVNADSIDIASTYVGQSSITTLGTISTGVWNGTDIAVADGGTGASNAAGAKTNLGFMTRVAANNTLLAPSSGIITWAVTHNLGTQDITVQVYDLSTLAEVEVDVVRTSTSVVTLSWVASGNVPADSYRVVVIG
jgi:hypothetical protein